MASHEDRDELLVCGRAGHRPTEFLRLLCKKSVESHFKTLDFGCVSFAAQFLQEVFII